MGVSLQKIGIDIPIDEFEKYRPNLYDPDTGIFDYARMKQRHEDMKRLREEHSGILLAAILSNYVDAIQFAFEDPFRRGKNIRIWFFQIAWLLDTKVLAYCGRDIGKTFTMTLKNVVNAINWPFGSHMITSFDQGHVKPRMQAIFKVLDEHPFFSRFASRTTGSRSSSFPMKQVFTNGYELHGIAVGAQSTKAAESPHVNGFSMDEGQHFATSAWKKMSPAINDMEVFKDFGAFQMIVGVNSEGDQGSVFYDKTYSKDSDFIGHIYHFPSWYNPINYTLAKHKDYLRLYGGSIHASDFKQMIRGMEGESRQGVISEADYLEAVSIGKKVGLTPKIVKISKKLWDYKNGDIFDILGSRFTKDLPTGKCIFSADIGGTAPTEIGIWYQMYYEESMYWALWGRVSMQGFAPNLTANIIDQLADIYGPDFLSIDASALTNAVTEILTDPSHLAYAEKNYDSRVYPCKFNGDITIDYVNDKPDDAGREYKPVPGEKSLWAIKGPANQYATELICKWLAEQRMAFPDDDMLKHDCLGMIAVSNGVGRQVVYKGTPQHIVSMIRAFVLLYHTAYTLKDLKAAALDYYVSDVPLVYSASIQLPD